MAVYRWRNEDVFALQKLGIHLLENIVVKNNPAVVGGNIASLFFALLQVNFLLVQFKSKLLGRLKAHTLNFHVIGMYTLKILNTLLAHSQSYGE